MGSKKRKSDESARVVPRWVYDHADGRQLIAYGEKLFAVAVIVNHCNRSASSRGVGFNETYRAVRREDEPPSPTMSGQWWGIQ